MSRHLSPHYGQVILVGGYPVLTAVNWSQHWCTICVQYQFSCATKLARKCEIDHWFSCGADGRAGCGRCTVTWLPNFLGWVDLLTHGAPQARFARKSSAIKWLSSLTISVPVSLYSTLSSYLILAVCRTCVTNEPSKWLSSLPISVCVSLYSTLSSLPS